MSVRHNSAVGFSFDPAVMLGSLLVECLYVRAVLKLRRRGWRVGTGQQVAWHGGVVLTAIGLLSPVDGLGEELLSAHMAQHLLIADLAAPLLLVGLRTPVLVHFLPRPALVAAARNKPLREAFRFVRKPIPAISLWVITLYGWHFGFAFEGALGNGLIHALQHESFVVASMLVWWPVLEPKRGPPARRAVEDRPPAGRAARGDDARDGLPDPSRARVRRVLRQQRP